MTRRVVGPSSMIIKNNQARQALKFAAAGSAGRAAARRSTVSSETSLPIMLFSLI